MPKDKQATTDKEAPRARPSREPREKKEAGKPDYVRDHEKRTGRSDDSPMSTQR